MTAARSAPPETIPVLIVGAGPAGSTASLLLARQGIASLVVERRLQPSILPRATGVNVRSMEIFRGLGLEARLDAAAMPAAGMPFAVVGETLSAPPRETIRSEQYEPPTDPAWPSPTFARWCAQDELEAVVLDALGEEPRADLRFGAELVSMDVDATVTAELRDVRSGETWEVAADYVLAADGASSGIRDSLGIGMDGQAGLTKQLSILFRADLDAFLHGRRFCLFHVQNDVLTGVVRPAGSSGRWLLGTSGTAAPPARCVELVRAAVGAPDLEVEIVATGAWEASALVADRFRAGPVFLVGDAAHLHTPGGGFGMNAAVAGAHNVAWKLAAVLDGWAGPPLLDTYETERRPLAELTTSLSADLLRAGGRQSARTLGVVLGARYRTGALRPDPTPASPPDDPVADYRPCARPGHRAPHRWLDAARTRSTLDLFGTGFVVCAPDPAGWDAGVRHAAAAGIPLRCAPLPRDAADAYGIDEGGAVLVRPDGYVAARWPVRCEDPTAALTTTLETMLRRGPERSGPWLPAGAC